MAQERQSGRVMVIFRFQMNDKLSPAEREEYNATAARLMEITSAMPGFISIREYSAANGENLGVTEWASAEALAAWRGHPEHRKAQQRGRELFYKEYEITICAPLHQYSFKRGE
jgi:heme-degrading monooxygenase HmoA